MGGKKKAAQESESEPISESEGQQSEESFSKGNKKKQPIKKSPKPKP
jgi:hypothetical protein